MIGRIYCGIPFREYSAKLRRNEFREFRFFASKTEQNYAKRRSLPNLAKINREYHHIRQHKRKRGTADLLRIRSICTDEVELHFQGTFIPRKFITIYE
jgi:hypothetical protein